MIRHPADRGLGRRKPREPHRAMVPVLRAMAATVLPIPGLDAAVSRSHVVVVVPRLLAYVAAAPTPGARLRVLSRRGSRPGAAERLAVGALRRARAGVGDRHPDQGADPWCSGGYGRVGVRLRCASQPTSPPSTIPASGANGTSVVTLTTMPTAKPSRAPSAILVARLTCVSLCVAPGTTATPEPKRRGPHDVLANRAGEQAARVGAAGRLANARRRRSRGCQPWPGRG